MSRMPGLMFLVILTVSLLHPTILVGQNSPAELRQMLDAAIAAAKQTIPARAQNLERLKANQAALEQNPPWPEDIRTMYMTELNLRAQSGNELAKIAELMGNQHFGGGGMAFDAMRLAAQTAAESLKKKHEENDAIADNELRLRRFAGMNLDAPPNQNQNQNAVNQNQPRDPNQQVPQKQPNQAAAVQKMDLLANRRQNQQNAEPALEIVKEIRAMLQQFIQLVMAILQGQQPAPAPAPATASGTATAPAAPAQNGAADAPPNAQIEGQQTAPGATNGGDTANTTSQDALN